MPGRCLCAGRHEHRILVGATRGDEAHRPPAGLVRLADRLCARARRHAIDQENIGLGVGKREDLRVHGGIGDFEARGHRDGLVGVGTERFLHAAQIILSGIVVLVKDRKAGIGILGPRIADFDAGFLDVIGRPRQRHQPGLRRRLVPFRRRADQEQMRHLGAVEIFRRRRTRRGAHGAEHEGDVVVLDQPARGLDRLRRRKAVVERDHVELAPVDAALLVDHVEIGSKYLAGDTERRRRAAIRHDIAEFDFGVGNAGLLGACRGRDAQSEQRGKKGRGELARSDHASSSPANGRQCCYWF